MRRPRSAVPVRVAVAALAFAAVLAVAAAPFSVAAAVDGNSAVGDGPDGAAAEGMHGNHLSLDPQVTGDGTVVVESLFTLRPGFVVLRADEDGRPGEPIGHTSLRGGEFRTDVPVTVNRSVWTEWSGNRTVWAVLHVDDGDGEFDIDSDRSLAIRNAGARALVSVGKNGADGADRVTAARANPRSVADGTVPLRSVDLSAPGHVVVEPVRGDRVLGSTSLAAGSHDNVTVELNESFLADRDRRFRVRAAAYHDDGDGVFGDADRRVTVGGNDVGTAFGLDPDGGSDDGSLINTPAGTPIPSDTPTATPTATESRSTDEAPRTTTDGDSGEGGPGFGVGGALVAIVAVALVALRRR